MTSKQFLQRLQFTESELAADRDELERLRQLSTSVPTMTFNGSGVHGTDPGDRTGGFAAKILDYERRINEKLGKSVELRTEIYTTIEKLPTACDRLVLKYRYLSMMNWSEIADAMGISTRTAATYHKRALRSLDFPGKTEDNI